MAVQPVVVGGTYDWFLNAAFINTEAAPDVFGPWDITSASVTISFMYYGNGVNASPTFSVHFAATIVSPTGGTAHYINSTSLFNIAGDWGMSWKVVNAGAVLETEISFFKVKASGAAA